KAHLPGEFIDRAAVIPVGFQFQAADVGFSHTGVGQGDLLGLVGGNGSAAAFHGLGADIILGIVVVGKDFRGGGVDLIVVFLGTGIGDADKFHIIHRTTILVFQLGPDALQVAFGQTGMFQSGRLGRIFP